MSSIPSTTASLFDGYLPSKPEHSLKYPEQDPQSLRMSRIASFLDEPPSAGNTLVALACTARFTASVAALSVKCPQTQNGVNGVVKAKDITEATNQSTSSEPSSSTGAA